MEEQTLKIINGSLLTNIKLNDGLREASKEITAMMMEFITWMIDEQEVFMGELTEKYIINDNPCHFESIEEMFKYWIENVKK
jgi:hypothetical protein